MKILFLTYVNRSGSTFLANQLSKSNDICVCPEANILLEIFLISPHKKINSKVLSILNKKFFNSQEYIHWDINKEEVLLTLNDNLTYFDCFTKLLEHYRNKQKPNAEIVLFKSERIIELYDSLMDFHKKPNWLFWISIIRDCRAVYNSQHNTFWPGTRKNMSNNSGQTALFWNDFINESRNLLEKDNFFELKYESLIKSSDKIIERIFLFVKTDYSKSKSDSGDLFLRLSENEKDIHENINSPSLTNRIDAWKSTLPRKDLCLIECIARKNLKILGYRLLSRKVKFSHRLHAYILTFFDIFRRTIKKVSYKLRILLKGY